MRVQSYLVIPQLNKTCVLQSKFLCFSFKNIQSHTLPLMTEQTCFHHWVFSFPWHENRNEMFSWSVATSKTCMWHFALISSNKSAVPGESWCQWMPVYKSGISCSWPWAVQFPRCHAHSSHFPLLQMYSWSFITSVISTKKQKVLSVLLSCCFISPWLKKRRCAHHL